MHDGVQVCAFSDFQVSCLVNYAFFFFVVAVITVIIKTSVLFSMWMATRFVRFASTPATMLQPLTKLASALFLLFNKVHI